MFRAMAMKELRETRGIALLGLVVYGIMLAFVSAQIRLRSDTIPFVSDGFLVAYIWLSCGFAIALGLRQSLGENIGDVYLFLFHRPATRRWLVGMKLLAGMVAYLTCGLLPIAVYGLAVSVPGIHASPFLWAMAAPAAVAWLAMTAVYCGAFLAGMRPGHWFYSRLFPVGGAFVAVLSVPMLLARCGPLVSLAPIPLIDAWLVATILFVVRTRDYS